VSDHPLGNICVVLYEPQDWINIAAVVRAMKNMGVPLLRLVRPVEYDPTEIERVAHDTRDVVARIRHFDTLDAALADCSSPRRRRDRSLSSWAARITGSRTMPSTARVSS
jgi:tRNA C32,U32 (ribose-2'-O)-methylase TrmJ